MAWSVLLLAPMFKLQFIHMREMSAVDEQSLFTPTFSVANVETLARKYPDDGVLGREKLRVKFPYRDEPYWRALDALIARLPDDLQLRRDKMLDATIGSLIFPVYQPDYGPEVQALPTQKERREQALKWLNEEQRATLAQQAREGARQKPNDGFFPWIEAVVLWDRDDEPALEALERAGKTTEFEDGAIANQLALMRWKQTQRELGWDEKLNFIYSTLLPHYAKFHELNREVIWSGIARYKRGDKVGAYRRWKIALEAAGAMRRAQEHNPRSLIIGLRVSEGLQRRLWGTVARELGGLDEKSTDAQNLAAFVALARRDGNNALANEAVSARASFQSEKIFRFDLDSLASQAAYRDAMNFNRIDTRLQLQLPWASRNVFWLSIAGASALLICLMLVWGERRLHHQFVGRVSVGQIAFFGALWLGVMGVATATRESGPIWILLGDGNSPPTPNFVNGLLDYAAWFWFAVALTLASAVALCYLQNARINSRLHDRTLPRGKSEQRASIGNLTIGGAWTAVFASAALWSAMPASENSFLGTVWIAFSLLAVSLTIVAVERRSAAPKICVRLFIVALICALVSFGSNLWFGFESGDIPVYLTLAGLFVAASVLVYLGATSRTWRPFFARAFTTGLQTLGGVAAICAIALLLASLAALPVRARQNRIVDDYIARGEIDWMKNQPEIRNVSKPVKRN